VRAAQLGLVRARAAQQRVERAALGQLRNDDRARVYDDAHAHEDVGVAQPRHRVHFLLEVHHGGQRAAVLHDNGNAVPAPKVHGAERALAEAEAPDVRVRIRQGLDSAVAFRGGLLAAQQRDQRQRVVVDALELLLTDLPQGLEAHEVQLVGELLLLGPQLRDVLAHADDARDGALRVAPRRRVEQHQDAGAPFREQRQLVVGRLDPSQCIGEHGLHARAVLRSDEFLHEPLAQGLVLRVAKDLGRAPVPLVDVAVHVDAEDEHVRRVDQPLEVVGDHEPLGGHVAQLGGVMAHADRADRLPCRVFR